MRDSFFCPVTRGAKVRNADLTLMWENPHSCYFLDPIQIFWIGQVFQLFPSLLREVFTVWLFLAHFWYVLRADSLCKFVQKECSFYLIARQTSHLSGANCESYSDLQPIDVKDTDSSRCWLLDAETLGLAPAWTPCQFRFVTPFGSYSMMPRWVLFGWFGLAIAILGWLR